MLFQRGSRRVTSTALRLFGLGVVLFQRGSRPDSSKPSLTQRLGVVLFQRGSRHVFWKKY